jgi:hypothetical protein
MVRKLMEWSERRVKAFLCGRGLHQYTTWEELPGMSLIIRETCRDCGWVYVRPYRGGDR